MTAVLWASRWYVKWQVTDAVLVDDLIEAAGRASAVLEAAGCTAPGEHEHPQVDDDPEEAGDVVARRRRCGRHAGCAATRVPGNGRRRHWP